MFNVRIFAVHIDSSIVWFISRSSSLINYRHSNFSAIIRHASRRSDADHDNQQNSIKQINKIYLILNKPIIIQSSLLAWAAALTRCHAANATYISSNGQLHNNLGKRACVCAFEVFRHVRGTAVVTTKPFAGSALARRFARDLRQKFR